MDESGYRELEEKRDTVGLTKEEADELGRMMAEREGKPYGNADMRENPEAGEIEDDKPYSEPELEEARRHRDVNVSDEDASRRR